MPNIKINFTENVPTHIRHNAADAA
ncbi:serine/arginine repetitive matrix 2, partial [Neisseria gonorrhoeae]